MNSQRLPGKNFRMLCGRPLVEWTLMLARCFYDRANVWIVYRGQPPVGADWELLNNYTYHIIAEPYFGEPTSSMNAVLTVPLEDRCYGVLLLQPTYVPRNRTQVEWFIHAADADGNTRTVDPRTNDANGNLYYVNDASKGFARNLDDHNPGVDIDTLEDFENAATLMAKRLALPDVRL